MKPADVIESALAVRRGQKRLKELNDADRPLVTKALRTMTDTQFALLAESKEHRTPRSQRCFTARTHRGVST